MLSSRPALAEARVALLPGTRSNPPARPAVFVTAAVAACVITGCGSDRPYPLTSIEGTVTYEDGEPIPADGIELLMVPQTPPIDLRVPPKPATVYVDAATGRFSSATTYRHNDGVIRGEHRVVVRALSGDRAAMGLVPKEYSRPDTTPLVVSTDETPIRIEVRRPSER